MPAVLIRQLDALAMIAEQTSDPARLDVLRHQAKLIERASEESVPDESDRADVRRRHNALIELLDVKEPNATTAAASARCEDRQPDLAADSRPDQHGGRARLTG